LRLKERLDIEMTLPAPEAVRRGCLPEEGGRTSPVDRCGQPDWFSN
jgi:hypothetical protein